MMTQGQFSPLLDYPHFEPLLLLLLPHFNDHTDHFRMYAYVTSLIFVLRWANNPGCRDGWMAS